MSSAPDHRPQACPNCGLRLAELPPPVHHCPQCGQETHLHPPTLFEFVHEFITHYVALEGALWRSLKTLLLSPGQLSLDYFAGRRRQHVLPLRIYLTASFLFFLAFKLGGGGPVASSQVPEPAAASASAASSAAVAAVGPSSASAAAASPASATAVAPAGSTPADVDDAEDPGAEQADSAEAIHANRPTDVADPGQEREIWQRCVNQPGKCSRFETLMARAMLKSTDPQTSVQLIFKQMLAWAPYAIFMMLPLFAGLLKAVYWRRGTAYGAHVVFSLHVHAYWFLAGLLVLWLPSPASDLLLWSMPVHAVLAMKRVYAGRWPATLGRAALVSLAYGLLLAAASLALAAGALLTT